MRSARHFDETGDSMIGDSGEQVFWNIVGIIVIVVIGALLLEAIRAWRQKP